jgi:TRAP-type C4-dicarboxylate transport system permease small subunit
MRWVTRLSNSTLSIEKWLITALAAMLVLLILLNVVTRAAGVAIFWVDELATYTMIWMAFIGASAMVRMRSAVAVTLITDYLPETYRRKIARVVDGTVVLLSAVVLYLCWQWYDPIALVRSGFDLDLFAQDTFKFIYNEPTNTIGIAKFWIWLAVPLMALGMTLHGLANLIEGTPSDRGTHSLEKNDASNTGIR